MKLNKETIFFVKLIYLETYFVSNFDLYVLKFLVLNLKVSNILIQSSL